MRPILLLSERERERERDFYNINNTQYKAYVQNYVMLCYKMCYELRVFIRTLVSYTLQSTYFF